MRRKNKWGQLKPICHPDLRTGIGASGFKGRRTVHRT